MDDGLEGRDVVSEASRFRKPQEPIEHGRDHLAMRDPVPLDEGAPLLGVEVLHYDDGRSEAQ